MPRPYTRPRTVAGVTAAALTSLWWAFACSGSLSPPKGAKSEGVMLGGAVDDGTSERDVVDDGVSEQEAVDDEGRAARPRSNATGQQAVGTQPPAPALPPAAPAAPPSLAQASAGSQIPAVEAPVVMAREQAREAAPRRAKPAPVGATSGGSASLDDLLSGALGGGGEVLHGMGPKAQASGYGRATLGVGGTGSAYGGGRGRRHAAAAPLRMAARPRMNTENYAHVAEAGFRPVVDAPLSTFSVDVDTASYSNMRRFIDRGMRPPVDAVRVEELINYFTYAYPQPRGDAPFSVVTEVASAPWNPGHRLLHVGLRGRSLAEGKVPPRNLVFLIDVSGSMRSHDKLPLLKQGLSMLTRQLRSQDRVAMVVYAGNSGVVLEPTAGDQQRTVLDALERLQAGGSTHGSAGIQLAYRLAQDAFIEGGINRVVLATDGDFNVGVTSDADLTRLIEARRRSGVFLTVLGFGTGNLQDARMEMLADKGNGNYAYIDSVAEAHKVLVREAGSTLVTIAKDVKLQLEFNPARVQSYRLIGYENRVLAARDFNDDRKDAGEIGAGHTVTALYELIPAAGDPTPGVDPLKYQKPRAAAAAAQSDELLTVELRYKHPDGKRSRLVSSAVRDAGLRYPRASQDFRWSAAIAGFGMLLRASPHRGDVTFDSVHALAEGAVGDDLYGDRTQALALMRRASHL